LINLLLTSRWFNFSQLAPLNFPNHKSINQQIMESFKALTYQVKTYLEGAIGKMLLMSTIWEKMGADAVGLGRAPLWPFYSLTKVIRQLPTDFEPTMALSGCKDISEMNSDC
jgi:hypothetical protein